MNQTLKIIDMEKKFTNYESPSILTLEMTAENAFAQSAVPERGMHDIFDFEEEYIWK